MAFHAFDFGIRNGVQTYRVNGDKDELEQVIKTVLKNDAKFEETPVLEPIRKGQWTTLIKLKVPVGVGEKVD